MKVTALAIASILLILAIAWKMSYGRNDATIHEQTDISAVSPATKTGVAKESESVSRVTDPFKTATSESIDPTNSIETKNPENEDSLSTGSQKVYSEMERNVMAMVSAEMQNPHLEIGESLVGVVSLEADFARLIIETIKGNVMKMVVGEHFFDETFENNAWELSLPSDSSTNMHFVKELGIDIEHSTGEVVDGRLVGGLVKVTLGYQQEDLKQNLD